MAKKQGKPKTTGKRPVKKVVKSKPGRKKVSASKPKAAGEGRARAAAGGKAENPKPSNGSASKVTYIASVEALVKFLEIPRSTFFKKYHKKHALCPKESKKGFKLSEAQTFKQFLHEGLAARGEWLDKDQELARLNKIKRQRAEFQHQQAMKKWVPIAEHREALAAVVDVCVETLEQVQGKVDSRLRDPKISDWLEKVIFDARDLMSQKFEDMGKNDSDPNGHSEVAQG